MRISRVQFFGLFILILSSFLFVLSLNEVIAQSSRSCETSAFKPSTEIKITNFQQNGITSPEALFDGNTQTAAQFKAGNSQSITYIMAKLPKPMVISKVEVSAETTNPPFTSNSGWNGHYVTVGYQDAFKLPQSFTQTQAIAGGATGCVFGALGSSFTSDNKTFIISPVKANFRLGDYVLIYGLYPRSDDIKISDIKIYGFDPNATTPVKLKGTVSLEKYSDMKLDGVSLYNDATNELLAKTDDDGNFIKENLPENTAITIRAEREGFKTAKKQVTLKSGDNTLNIPLPLEEENQITGRITLPSGASSNELILAYSNGKLYKLIYSDPNNNGQYTLKGFAPGTYELKIKDTFATETKYFTTQPNVTTVTFTKPFAQKEVRNIAITDNIQASYSLKVTVIEDPVGLAINNSFLVGNEIELPNARIEVTSLDAPSTNPKRTAVSPANFTNMSPGKYHVVATKDGYKPRSLDVIIRYPGEKLTYIGLTKQNSTYCEKVPKTNVKEFWLCGSDAKSFKPDAKLDTIDTTIGQIRQAYGYKDLPQSVVIYSSNATSSFYSPDNNENQTSCSPPIPTNLTSPAGIERLEMTSAGLRKKSNSQVVDTVMHEIGGHGRDWHSGNCKGFRSSQADYLDLRTLGARFGSQFYSAFKDDTFSGSAPGSGHPDENATETFASIFNACYQHNQELQQKTASLVKPLRKSIFELGKLTLTPKPCPGGP